MEIKLTYINPGRVQFDQTAINWIGRSVRRKRIISQMIDKFTVGDFGRVSFLVKIQNDFVLNSDQIKIERGYIELRGCYPLIDGSGQITIKRERNYYTFEVITNISFEPYDQPKQPEATGGNMLKIIYKKV